ncbi:MAG: hypothetical protein ACXU93_13720 [Thermodesulfobacteriota bacterium]
MKIKSVLSLSFCFLVVGFFVTDKGRAQPKPGTHAPIITHAFALDRGYYGSIWRIYIEAEDPDGDMLKVASVVEQPAYGTYPTDWIYLKPAYQKSFKGYIQWNTFSSKTAYIKEWTEITLKVSVFDKAGNISNEVVFPFTFVSGTKSPDTYKPPDPFDQGNLPRLGYMNIDLFEPTEMGGGDGGGGQN